MKNGPIPLLLILKTAKRASNSLDCFLLRMKRYYWLVFLVGAMSLKCTPEPFLSPPEPSKLVIWGGFHPDSLFEITLSKSFSPFEAVDSNDLFVENAIVRVFENGLLIDTLRSIKKGVYQSISKRPIAGYAYHVEAEKVGFPLLQTLPDTMPIAAKTASIVGKSSPFSNNPDIVKAKIEWIFDSPFSEQFTGYRTLVLGLSVGSSLWFKSIYQNCGTLYSPVINRYRVGELSCSGGSISQCNFECAQIDKVLLSDGVQVSLGFFTPQTCAFFLKINEFDDLNIDRPGVNAFYNPVIFPQLVNGGYGIVYCYNTVDTLIHF